MLSALLFSACKPDTDALQSAGYEYFPLVVGQTWVYDVQETQYVLSGGNTQKNYQVREVVAEKMKNLNGQEEYRLERFRRASANQGWVIDSVWTARLSPDQAVRVENNVAFVKLMFPLQKALRWNGNLLNSWGKNDYEVENTEGKLNTGRSSFDKVLIIKQKNDSSGVSRDKRYEYFAPNVGLIYKENTQLFYCYTPDCLGKGKIDYGIKRVYQLIEFTP